MNKFFYLASQSPRRKEILDQLRAPYRLLKLVEGPASAADFDETPLKNENPVDYVRRTAFMKANAGWKYLVHHNLEQAPVLAADTTVTTGNNILGKPEDATHARVMLRSLSGRAHQVLTAVTMKFENTVIQELSTTDVKMKKFGNNEIEAYINTGEPFGKAGSYGIQGMASIFINHISGSYSGVVGLPIYETSELIKKFGFTLL
jgi:septum formation protein